MSFHVLAFSGSVASSTAWTALAPIADRVMRSETDGFTLARPMELIAAHVRGATLGRGRITLPSLRSFSYPCIRPIQVGLTNPDCPKIANYDNNPFNIPAFEKLNVDTMLSSGSTAETHYAVLFLREGYKPAPRGQIITLRGTDSTSISAGAWTLINPTWADTLMQGVYALVGLEVVGTGVIAGRVVFEDQLLCPGAIGVNGLDDIACPMNRLGARGEWGRFNSFRMPQIEVLSHTAGALTEVFIDVVRVG